MRTSLWTTDCWRRTRGITVGRRASQLGQIGPRDGLQDPQEQRDPESEPKMAEILCVYRQVAVLRERGQSAASAGEGMDGSLAIISYDETPGIQAIGTTALAPLPGRSPTVMRDHEYKRDGTLTLMAGIDLLSGHVHALVKAIAVVNSSSFSSSWTPHIRPIPQSRSSSTTIRHMFRARPPRGSRRSLRGALPSPSPRPMVPGSI
jgi:hypothetical protein